MRRSARTAKPRETKATLVSLLLGTLSSWGSTSKNVMYRNVPPATPENKAGLQMPEIFIDLYLGEHHYKYHWEDLEVDLKCRYQSQSRWGQRVRTRCWI